MKKNLCIFLFLWIARQGWAQDPLLRQYRLGDAYYREDFTVPNVFKEGKKINAVIENGYLLVHGDDWFPKDFSLRDNNYYIEVLCDASPSGMAKYDGDLGKANTKTIVFDGAHMGDKLRGMYISYCRQLNHFYYSIGYQDGDVFTEIKRLDDTEKDGNESKYYEMALAGRQYTFYVNRRFLCSVPADENRGGNLSPTDRTVYLENNLADEPGYYFKVTSLVVKTLVPVAAEKKVADLPLIKVFTPKEGNIIAADNLGRVMVSGQVKDPSGIAWVRVNGQNVGDALQADGYFYINVSGVTNEIDVQAQNSAGLTATDSYTFKTIASSEDAHIPVIPKDDPPVFDAVLIACSKYADTTKNVPEAIGDVTNLNVALEANYGFKDQNVHLLVDKTYDDIILELRSVMASMKGHDNLVITFSGHGTYNQDKTNPVGYWITGSGTDYDHGYISSEKIKEMLVETNCQAKHVLILSDACYSGAFRDLSTQHMSYAETTAYNYGSTKVLTSCGFEKSPVTSVFMTNVIKVLNDNATIYKSDYLSDIAMHGLVLKAVKSSTGNEPDLFEFGTHNNQGGNFYFILDKK
jgi:hypothetical protein